MTNPTPIEAVRTDITAFIGRTRRGPAMQPTRITSFAEFAQRFGGLWAGSTVSYAVQNYFENGGAVAVIVRIRPAGADAQIVEALQALSNTEFNLLCIPPVTRTRDVQTATWVAAAQVCKTNYAMLIVDPPAAWQDTSSAVAGAQALRDAMGDAAAFAALYFPRLVPANNAAGNSVQVPCGAVAGKLANNDLVNSVWKQVIAGSRFAGIARPSIALSTAQIEVLTPAGVNVIRRLPDGRTVLWGGRTLSSDPEWKYVPVRRYVSFLQSSIDKGLEWAVFEPNNEPLWINARRIVEEFLFVQWRQGALQGTKPEQAYFVKCDRSTMTQDDLDNGRLVVMIGVAAVRPAEFVIFRIGKHTAG
jgi:phage tail sheath protein FI